MHKKRNEAENPFFFSSPKNKTRLLKEKDNEKSPAQQGSTLKRKKNHFNIIQGTGFFFFFLIQKKGTSYIIYPNKQTKQRTEDKDKHALTLNKNALTTLTHSSPHKLKM